MPFPHGGIYLNSEEVRLNNRPGINKQKELIGDVVELLTNLLCLTHASLQAIGLVVGTKHDKLQSCIGSFMAVIAQNHFVIGFLAAGFAYR